MCTRDSSWHIARTSCFFPNARNFLYSTRAVWQDKRQASSLTGGGRARAAEVSGKIASGSVSLSVCVGRTSRIALRVTFVREHVSSSSSSLFFSSRYFVLKLREFHRRDDDTDDGGR